MLKENSYFEQILGKEHSSFINIFKNTWNDHIATFPRKYINCDQFIIGARFRPVMMCWGYVLSEGEFDYSKKKELSKLALYIELLHKATLLIDDLIDDDSSRHGKRAFHIQYSPTEAILFATYLVGDSFEQLSKVLKNYPFEKSYFDISLLLSQTIKDMTLGALQEVNLDKNKFTSFELINEIVENQTISIIKNGLLTGYKFGNGKLELMDVVDSIGYDCGYIFQLLNDLEPFGNSKLNSIHKGNKNIDVLRSRKNLIIAFIFNSLNKKDRTLFHDLLNNNHHKEGVIIHKIFQYYQDYNVIESILDNLKNVRANIDTNIQTLETKICNKILNSDFKKFINFILNEAIMRIGSKNQSKLSEILIK